MLAGFLGWTLDAFDFFLVIMSMTAIGKELHKTDAQMALSVTLTLAMRPIGAIIFGLIADRYGRRMPLILDLLFYSVVEVCTGLVHTYSAFLVLRALFGIGMGGEWGVGASLTMEQVPPRWRGLLSGLLQEGYAAGYLLAAAAYFVVFPRWGWRPLFFIGGLPALLALFVRVGVKESQAWEATRAADWKALWRGIVRALPMLGYLVLLMTMMNLASHGTQDIYPTFLERDWHLGPRSRATVTAISMVGAIGGGLLFGAISNRLGRRNTIALAFLGALLAIPFWARAGQLGVLVAGAFVLQFMVQGAWGIIPAHLCELAPAEIRGFAPGFAYQCGNLVASHIVVLEAVLARRSGYSATLTWSAAVIFAVAAVAALAGPERRGITFGRPA